MNIPSTTLVTCSYAPDYDRCVRLCASVERFVDQSVPHILIVPARGRCAVTTAGMDVAASISIPVVGDTT